MHAAEGFSSTSTIEDAVKQGYYSANFSTAEPYPLWSSGNPDADDVD